MSDGNTGFEQAVVFRVGRYFGMLASGIGLVMVVLGCFLVFRAAVDWISTRGSPSVSPAEVAARVKESKGSSQEDEEQPSARTSEPIPGCDEKLMTSIAEVMASEISKSRGDVSRKIHTVVRSQCENTEEAFRGEFLSGGLKAVQAAPTGAKAEHWDAYHTLFDKKEAKAVAKRNNISSLASVMVAGGVSLGGFVMVALFGALLALLAMERNTRIRSLGQTAAQPSDPEHLARGASPRPPSTTASANTTREALTP
jgi:hypothetical protein